MTQKARANHNHFTNTRNRSLVELADGVVIFSAEVIVHRRVFVQPHHQAVFSITCLRLVLWPFGYGSSGKPSPLGAVAAPVEDLSSSPEPFILPGVCEQHGDVCWICLLYTVCSFKCVVVHLFCQCFHQLHRFRNEMALPWLSRRASKSTYVWVGSARSPPILWQAALAWCQLFGALFT